MGPRLINCTLGATTFRVRVRVAPDGSREYYHAPCGQWFPRLVPEAARTGRIRKSQIDSSWVSHPCPGLTPERVREGAGVDAYWFDWEKLEALLVKDAQAQKVRRLARRF